MKNLALSLASILILSACSPESTNKSQEPTSTLSQSQVHAHGSGAKVPAAVHGMVIFGENEIFASHIPMFMIPHDWQALFKVRLSHPTVDAMAAYKKARAKNGTQALLTLQPKPFVLPPLLEGKTKSFEAALYLGNFETDGKQLLSGITVTVEKILEVHHLSPENVALDSLQYYLVQDGKSGYLVHQISAPDNFDHIMQVDLPAELALQTSGKLPVLDFSYADNLEAKLKKGQSFTLTPEGKLVQTSMGGDSTLNITSDFYCTLGPDFVENCD